jgi:hypothetical protein
MVKKKLTFLQELTVWLCGDVEPKLNVVKKKTAKKKIKKKNVSRA